MTSVLQNDGNPLPADHDRLMREAKYWEAAYDRVLGIYLKLKESHDLWMEGHNSIVEQIKKWEGWYKNLEHDRDLYKQWDSDKKQEIYRLNRVAADVRGLAETLHREHERVVAQVIQWETWYKDLQQNRDLYKQWDVDKKQEIERLNKVVTDLRGLVEVWQRAHTNVLAQVKQWEVWYADIQRDRNRYKQWDAEKKQEIERLNIVLSDTRRFAENWQKEHGKVVNLVKQWEMWYKSLQEERDLYKQWDQHKKLDLDRKNQDILQLQQWIEKLLKNPFRYAFHFFRHMFTSKK